MTTASFLLLVSDAGSEDVQTAFREQASQASHPRLPERCRRLKKPFQLFGCQLEDQSVEKYIFEQVAVFFMPFSD